MARGLPDGMRIKRRNGLCETFVKKPVGPARIELRLPAIAESIAKRLHRLSADILSVAVRVEAFAGHGLDQITKPGGHCNRSIRHVPDPQSIRVGNAQTAFAIGTELDASHLTVMFEWFAHRIACQRVPQTGSAILRSCQNQPTIRAELCVSKFVLVAHGLGDRLTGGRVPDTSGAIFRASQHPFAIRTEMSTQHPALVR